MLQSVEVKTNSDVVSVEGTINGVRAEFIQLNPDTWMAEVERSMSGRYELDITMANSVGSTNRLQYSVYYFYGWTDPIYDRLPYDVESGTEKGYLNYSDLNRIETNTRYLLDSLNEYGGYKLSMVIKTDWTPSSIPYLYELNRIKTNVGTISDAFYKLPLTPALPANMEGLTIEKLNDLEKILFDTYYLLDNVIKSFRYSGTFYSGGVHYGLYTI